MRKLTFLICLFLFSGCRAFRSTQSQKPPDALPGTYTVAGVTAVDYQIIQPIRCVDSVVIVEVKRPDEAWETCNLYEVKIDTTGTGGGGIWLEKKVTKNEDGTLTLYGTPVAPKGTEYKITSTLNSSKELY